ncbi:M20/M25/M40 family metallo-hydrolase [Paludibaculum fermentans]|uniref:M20/M25/M40 family metallo-hydrolase n=1 Tax=Paludibaculum fermentans TaxID=1473598 RepID=UPI003EB8F637
MRFTIFLLCLSAWAADVMPPEPEQRLARVIYQEMIEVKSGFTTGSTTPIAESVAARFKAAGFPVEDIFVGGAIPTKANVVVRYRGTGARKPLLLLAHTDVVEAKREDWTVDPFVFLEKDGYFYGRGTSDDKAQAAVWVATLLRLKRENYRPDRDLILALTADEEGGGPYNGVNWLIEKHRALIDAEYALNEGARGMMVGGKRVEHQIGLAEKQFLNLRWEVRNKGGHSARPVPDNAIYHLAAALQRLSGFEFDFALNEVTREYFRQSAKMEASGLAADMARVAEGDRAAMRRVAAASAPLNAMLRTTCVATQLEGGHATNALPQLAAANVNCRLLPDDSVESVVAQLTKLVGDDQVKISVTTNEGASPVSPLRDDIMKAFTRITDTMWPGVITVPSMAVGGTDGRYLRSAGIPTYGVQGFFLDRDDVRAHGRDERMPVKSFYEGQTFLYEFVKALSK